ncbi:MAG: ferritin-like domain-containing protein [Phycisphaerales bacterium]
MPLDEKKKTEIVRQLILAYTAELETVANYIANSVNLDGVMAEPIKESLGSDVEEELGHARTLADRLRVLGATVPGSLALKFDQKSMQPPDESTDLMQVVNGVIEAETQAIERYEKIIELCSDSDPVTEDIAITLLADEQEHRREFEGFKKALSKVT